MKVRYSFLNLLSVVLADVEFLSINLKGWQNCDNAQMAKISSAWESAVKMAAALRGNINFNEAAAVEYLGPPAYTSDYADEIRQVFENAATFGQGSKWTPTPLKWDAYVRCDDWRRRCARPGVRAYTTNHMSDPNGKKPQSDYEHDTSTPVMNFCPSFFKMDTFAEKVAQNKNKEISQKYNLEYYFVNRDLVVLHELMHADVVTYKRNDNRHINDMMFKLKDKPDWKTAYGPVYTKLFTRVEESYNGGWVTQNADSFALYALAKAVQKALGDKYPYLPRPYNEEIDDTNKSFQPHPTQVDNGILSWTPNMEGYFHEEEAPMDETCSASTVAAECPPLIVVSKIVDDSKYPKEYLEQRTSWLKEISGVKFDKLPAESTTEGPVPDNVSQNCNFDPVFFSPVPPIDTEFAKEKILEVCKLFKDITLDATTQPQVQMHYEAVGSEMYPYAAWNAGDPRCITRSNSKISESDCVNMFNELVNGCPSDNPKMTYGGSKVDNCIVYGFGIDRKFKLAPESGRKRKW